MFDDLFDEIDISRGSKRPGRHQALFRLAFGILGVALSAAGAVRCLGYASVPFRIAAAAVFVSLALVCLFNVALARTWRWPLLLFAASLPALIVTRLVFLP